MSLGRRQFISSLLAAGLFPALSSVLQASEIIDKEAWLSAQGKDSGRYGLGWVNEFGVPNTVLSGFRGHGVVLHPFKQSTVIMFARRPGTECIEVNYHTGMVSQSFQCAENRHLFGHGCFSGDGSVLFSVESDYQSGAGKIGIRDSQNYQLLGEYESYGVGPHEIKMMPDGNTLVIANGGIQTHPDSGRKKLNIESMQSSLIYLDSENGKKIAEFHVTESKASIRHVDVAIDGTVAIAMQVQRTAMGHDRTVALSAIQKPNKLIELLVGPEPLIVQMKDYMGSVTINNESRLAGFTSPRGNVVAFWHIDELKFVGYHAFYDVCGIAVSSDQKRFIISNSSGQVRQLDAWTLLEVKEKRVTLPNIHWDNHLLVTG